MDGLRRLVGDLRTVRAAWEQEPFVSRELGSFDDVFSVEIADRLVRGGLPLSAIRLVSGGERVPTSRLARAGVRPNRTREQVVDPGRVARRVASGATLIIEELRTFSVEVGAFADRLVRETGYDAYCAAFLTPRFARGVAPHYDTVSVFIRQVHGSKRWRVSEPVLRWPSREWEHGSTTDTKPVLDVTLHPGDCLYIPRGFIHVGDTTHESSVHLSVGLRPVSWGSMLGSLLASATQEHELLREAVPPRFADVDRDKLFDLRVRAMAECLAQLGRHGGAEAVRGFLATPADEDADTLINALDGEGDPPHGDDR